MRIEEYEFVEIGNKADIKGAFVELTYPDYYQSSDFTGSLINLYKEDAIALAKHFKLTEEDLK